MRSSKMSGVLFSILLIFFCCMGGNNQVRAFDCTSNDGSCTWISPESCIDPEKYCGNTAECLVVTKSINSSYVVEMAANYNKQFQCRCPIGGTSSCNPYAVPYVDLNCTTHRPTDSSVSISVNDVEDQFLSIVYAEMWRCRNGDNSVIQCPSGRMRIGNEFGCKNVAQLLPNVFSLVQFWCQFKKTTCEFDSSLILSHVGQSLQLSEQSSLPDHYIFEWGSGMMKGETFECGNSSQSVFEYDSCYRLTPPNLEWKAARSHCLQFGGDLAQFTNEKSFASILRSLDHSIASNITISTAIPIWFKWYTWTGDQRMPQHFLQYTDGFQCSVYDFVPEEGVNPLGECIAGTKSKKVRGLCVFPPRLSSDNFDYVQLFCPAKCDVSGYPDYCWAEAEADTKVSQSCPPGLNGIATWKCGVNGQWGTPSPDLSNCTNPVVDDSINQANDDIAKGQDPGGSLNGLTNAIKDNDVASGNIVQLDQTVKFAIQKQTLLMATTTDPSLRDESSKNFTISVIDLNNVLMESSDAFWGLEWTARSEAIGQVQKNVDDTLYLLAENLLDQVFKYGSTSFQNIAVQVENKVKTDYNNQTYTYVVENENQLTLPSGFPYSLNDANTRLSFTTYNAFQYLLYGDTLATLFEENNQTTVEPIGQVLVSKVLGATLGQPNGSIHLVDGKVEILLSTLNLDLYEVNEESATCVYWDVLTQDWSSDGCEVVAANGVSTKCQCDHLTNFAVLMDINGVFKNKTTSALDYITIIGESISIACLTLALIIFFWVRTLRRDFRFMIHRNLCLNLLIAEILLLAGIDATANRDLCLSIAVFLHFFFLCAFSWMLVEGLYMYFVVTKVFEGKVLKNWQYYVIGYGLPTLVVAITLGATNTNAYINPSYCWLSYDDGAIWAFAGPAAAVVLINIGFLLLTLTIACKSRQNINARKNMFQLILGTISLTFVLGITWLFGFIFFGQDLGEGIVFAYIFTILNSLQGFFIFITFCVLNKQVRNDLHKQITSNQKFREFFGNFGVESNNFRMFFSSTTGFYNVMEKTNSIMNSSQSSAPSVELHLANSSFQS